MLFSDKDRLRLDRNQIAQTICQIRFPPILSIGAKEPVRFQEKIRREYPQYAVRTEKPQKVQLPGMPISDIESGHEERNYNFISPDGKWRINLTNAFFAISTGEYRSWEDFARRLDMPFAQFIKIYEPSYFERIGLRYINAISRSALGLDGVPWSELISPAYLGVLAEEDVAEKMVLKTQSDAELILQDGCRARIHAGPGQIHRQNQPQDPEIRFILDVDLSVTGKMPLESTAAQLEKLHQQAGRLFRGALTRRLLDAME
jgi:uncharacterized protein (TIGR04255 family)